MSERDGYQHGVPCWIDTWRRDPGPALGFYAGLFGWDIEGGEQHRMCRKQGADVAAIGAREDAPAPAWNTYVWVDDADATTAAAREAGGSVVMEPFASLDGGRMAILADPDGAAFGVWAPGAHKGAERVNESGAWAMSMLSTPDPERAAAFYGALFGWTTEAFGDAAILWRLPGYVGGEPQQPVSREVIAAMAPGEGPARWNVDFWLEDVDASAARVQQLGGSVVMGPFDGGPGRQAVLADPDGAAFSISWPAIA